MATGGSRFDFSVVRVCGGLPAGPSSGRCATAADGVGAAGPRSANAFLLPTPSAIRHHLLVSPGAARASHGHLLPQPGHPPGRAPDQPGPQRPAGHGHPANQPGPQRPAQPKSRLRLARGPAHRPGSPCSPCSGPAPSFTLLSSPDPGVPVGRMDCAGRPGCAVRASRDHIADQPGPGGEP